LIRRLAAIATAFNRRETTLLSLAHLLSQEGNSNLSLTVFLVDDGSTDGTADAVKRQFPHVRLLLGSGSLYWNGGMRFAFASAMQEDFDAYIWFNDDSNLYPDALTRLVACAEQQLNDGKGAIVTGSMQSPATRQRTYGGWKKHTRGIRLTLEAVTPDPRRPLACDTINGNFTLITRSVALALGNLDEAFTHQLGDLDYGLRAKAAGFDVVVAPGFFGECSDNSPRKTWRDQTLSLGDRWRHLQSPKGAPPKEWILYTRRHYGWRWPLYALSPYVRTLLGLSSGRT
jgi:GT2 family glycosyltransferase